MNITLKKYLTKDKIIFFLFILIYFTKQIFKLSSETLLSSITRFYITNFGTIIIFITYLGKKIIAYYKSKYESEVYSLKKSISLSCFSILTLDLIYCVIISLLFLILANKYSLDTNQTKEILTSIILYTIPFLLLSNSFLFPLKKDKSKLNWLNSIYTIYLIYILFNIIFLKTKYFDNLLESLPINKYFYTQLIVILLASISYVLLSVFISLYKNKKNSALIILILTLVSIGFTHFTYIKCIDLAPTKIESEEVNTPSCSTTPTTIGVIETPFYSVSKYDMDVTLKENFYNKCTMKVNRINSSIKDLHFNFYTNSKINKLTVNNVEANFTCDASTISIKIPDNIDDLDLTIYIEYSSYIYTSSYSGIADYVTNNSAYLSVNFPWYPRLDNKEKEFNLKINTSFRNLYSNLNVEKNNDSYTLTGLAKNLYIFSGYISKTSYDNYTIISSDLLIKDSYGLKKQMDELEKYEKKYNLYIKDLENKDTIIFVPSSTYINFSYDKTYVNIYHDIRD